MGKQIQIYEPGKIVTLNGDVEAKILTVQIFPSGYLSYEVVWWNNGDRKTAWVKECEITSGCQLRRVGFFNGERT